MVFQMPLFPCSRSEVPGNFINEKNNRAKGFKMYLSPSNANCYFSQ